MPLNSLELQSIGKSAIDHYRKNAAVDQINVERPLLTLLEDKAKDLVGGQEFVVSQIFTNNGASGQNYSGNGRVTYNTRNPTEQAKFRFTNSHDGFTVNEDSLFRSGIQVTDDIGKSLATRGEVVAMGKYMGDRLKALDEGFKEYLNAMVWLDGTQSVDAIPGVDALVSLTPAVGTVGGINAATNVYWRNQAATGIAPTMAAMLNAMEVMKRNILRTKGRVDRIFAGGDFIDALRNAVLAANVTQVTYNGGASIGIDMATKQMKFDGVAIEYIPDFDNSFGTAPAIPFAKRCYMLDTRYINLARSPDDWMKMRYPGRPVDQYVYFYAITAKYGMEITGRNKQGVLAIA